MIYTRSPYYITQKSNYGIGLRIKIWEVGKPKPDFVENYVMFKKTVERDDNGVIVKDATFNISNVIRDFYRYEIDKTPILNVEIFVEIHVNEHTISPDSYSITDQAMDGYGYFEQGRNPTMQRISFLNSSNRVRITEGTDYLLNINGFANFEYMNITSFPSGKYSQRVLIMKGLNHHTIKAIDYQGEDYIIAEYRSQRMDIQVDKSNCRYSPVKCTFLNKSGCWESMIFNKKRNVSISRESEEFMRNSYVRQFQEFNVNARDTFSINTGWIFEEQNETIRQLFLSEHLFLDGVAYNLETKNLEFKTKNQDALINYDLKFKQAFNKINNV